MNLTSLGPAVHHAAVLPFSIVLKRVGLPPNHARICVFLQTLVRRRHWWCVLAQRVTFTKPIVDFRQTEIFATRQLIPDRAFLFATVYWLSDTLFGDYLGLRRKSLLFSG